MLWRVLAGLELALCHAVLQSVEMQPPSTETEAFFIHLTCYALFKEALQNTAIDLSRSSGILVEGF